MPDLRSAVFARRDARQIFAHEPIDGGIMRGGVTAGRRQDFLIDAQGNVFHRGTGYV
jgi:hypothetical protein